MSTMYLWHRGHRLLMILGCKHIIARRVSTENDNHQILGRIRELPFIPKIFTCNDGTKLQVDFITRNQACAIYRLISHRFEQKSIGISNDEMPDEAAFIRMLEKSDVAAAISDITDSAKPQVAGIIQVQPQLACRSAVPVLHGNYVILGEGYDGLGATRNLMKLFATFGMAAGYLGNLTRAALAYTPSVFATMKIGAMVTGVIPRSVTIPGYGLSDDATLHANYSLSVPNLPQAQLSEDDVTKRAVGDALYKKHYASEFALHIDEAVTSYARLCTAQKNAVDQVYRMLAYAAAVADGFGIDEFPTSQIFCDKFLHNRTLLLLTNHSGLTIGAAIAGPCHMCRSNDPQVATLYVYIAPEYRNKGIGGAVIDCVSRHLAAQGYTGLLCDVLMTSKFPHSLLRRLGFYHVGSIPYSAYTHAHGWTDAALYFRDFTPALSGTWVLKDIQFMTNRQN